MSLDARAAAGRGKAGQGGFTLLELLAVIVIMGVMATVALLSADLGGAEARLREEAQRVRELTTLLCEESILRSRQQGLVVFDQGYGFAVLGTDDWMLREDRPFGLHTLPAEIVLDLEVEGRRAAPAEDLAPQAVCYSSGEATPFRLRLSAPATQTAYLVLGDGSGAVKLETRDAP